MLSIFPMYWLRACPAEIGFSIVFGYVFLGCNPCRSSHPTSAVPQIYSGRLETHLLLGSTRFLPADENRNFCKSALDHCKETSLLQHTEHGNSHRFWGTHQKRAAKWVWEEKHEIHNWHQLVRFWSPLLWQVKPQHLVSLLFAFVVLHSNIPQTEVSRRAAHQWLCPGTQTRAVWTWKTNQWDEGQLSVQPSLSNTAQRPAVQCEPSQQMSAGLLVQNSISIALFK